MILTRYLFRAILVRLALALPALVLIYMAFELGDQGRLLAASAGWGKALRVTLLHLPLVAVQVLPAALLLSTVLALAALRRRGELEAMVSFGMAPGILCRPILTAGLLVSILALLTDELAVPPCEQRADRLTGWRRPSALTGLSSPPSWARHAGWFVHLDQGRGARQVVALELDRRFQLVQRVDGWMRPGQHDTLTEVTLRSGDRKTSAGTGMTRRRVPAYTLPEGMSQPMALLEQPAPRAEALDLIDLSRRLARLEGVGHRRPAERLVLHTKIAFPLLNLVVAMLACPFVSGYRRRSTVVDLAWASLLILGLWAMLAAGWMMARSGWIGPAAGVWLPLAVGFAAGAALLCGRKRPWRR